MKTLRPIVSVLALAGGLLLSMPLLAESPGPSATPSAKIAVVDIQRAALETEDGLRAQAQLRKYFDRRQAELNARQDDLLRKKDEIERQSKVLSKDALMRAMEDWQHQMLELQGVYGGYQDELARKRNEITAPIFARISQILKKVAKRDGYDIILERQAVPYARQDLDLTDLVITLYNSGEDAAAAGSAAPPPASTTAPPANSR